MDNWFRFQYLTVSEMWGHTDKEEAGRVKTGASGVGGDKEKLVVKPKT